MWLVPDGCGLYQRGVPSTRGVWLAPLFEEAYIPKGLGTSLVCECLLASLVPSRPCS